MSLLRQKGTPKSGISPSPNRGSPVKYFGKRCALQILLSFFSCTHPASEMMRQTQTGFDLLLRDDVPFQVEVPAEIQIPHVIVTFWHLP